MENMLNQPVTRPKRAALSNLSNVANNDVDKKRKKSTKESKKPKKVRSETDNSSQETDSSIFSSQSQVTSSQEGIENSQNEINRSKSKCSDTEITFKESQSHDSGNSSRPEDFNLPLLCDEKILPARQSSEEDLQKENQERKRQTRSKTRQKAKENSLPKPKLKFPVATGSTEASVSTVKHEKEYPVTAQNWDLKKFGLRHAEFTRAPENIYDPDEFHLEDPHQSGVYASDIFLYYRLIDHAYRPDDYLIRQEYITNRMRGILVDWMVEVQETMELNHETLYTGVRLVDLFLSRKENLIRKSRLQLIGAVALIIAAKMDDRLAPPLEDYVYFVDGIFNKPQVFEMEREMLVTLEWNLCVPTAYRVLRRYSKVAQSNMELLTMARYILESSLLNYSLSIHSTDHELAAGSLYLAMLMKKSVKWDASMEWHTGFKSDDLVPIARALSQNLMEIQANPAVLTIHRKYTHELFYNVGSVPLLAQDSIC